MAEMPKQDIPSLINVTLKIGASSSNSLFLQYSTPTGEIQYQVCGYAKGGCYMVIKKTSVFKLRMAAESVQ
jgi:hypothetical protein